VAAAGVRTPAAIQLVREGHVRRVPVQRAKELPVYKVLIFLKRREGLSREDFIDHYENVHRPLAEKHLTHLVRYTRRYVEWLAEPRLGGEQGLDFDVVTELWFESREHFDEAMARLGTPPASDEIAADEEQLFDRSRLIWASVTEYDSDLRSTQAAS
jgi:uncharacterized protein (TIGR02118 family)